jgi:hypothetical protein
MRHPRAATEGLITLRARDRSTFIEVLQRRTKRLHNAQLNDEKNQQKGIEQDRTNEIEEGETTLVPIRPMRGKRRLHEMHAFPSTAQ